MAGPRRQTNEKLRRKAQVLLVDDHPVVREGLTRVIEQQADLTVSATAASVREALDAVSASLPDVVVVDVSLDGSQGIDLVKELRARHPKIPVLMLSMHDETLYAERALRAGAKGYLMKREPPQKVVQAIRKVLSGGLSFSETVTAWMLESFSGSKARQEPLPMERLSDREIEVLHLIGQGRTTRQIAEALHLSMKTVQAHREHIKEKLQLPDATSLLRFAVHWVDSDRR
jgi:DNA-binding NarL/FixJ family response regulator